MRALVECGQRVIGYRGSILKLHDGRGECAIQVLSLRMCGLQLLLTDVRYFDSQLELGFLARAHTIVKNYSGAQERFVGKLCFSFD